MDQMDWRAVGMILVTTRWKYFRQVRKDNITHLEGEGGT